jgi:hypothetical protein
MSNDKLKRVCALVLSALLMTAVLLGCNRQGSDYNDSVFTSFQSVPGITAEEIEAVEALQRSGIIFRYASIYGTEMFVDENGRMKGFSALFCAWLSELFEIPFVPRIVEWDELTGGMENGTIHFTGELAANDDRYSTHYFTDDIAQRQIITLRMTARRRFRKSPRRAFYGMPF